MDANKPVDKTIEKSANKILSYGVKVAIMILPVVAGIYVVRQIDKLSVAKKGKGWGM